MLANLLKVVIACTIGFSALSQDCFLEVPNDPLNTGLFQPWFVSTNPISTVNCSQTVHGTEVFVEATIVDTQTGKLFVYNPLVIDKGTQPAVPPFTGTLPSHNQVIINVGANGNSVTLIQPDGVNSLQIGKCVNGLPGGTIFGQVAYCNAVSFYTTVNSLIGAGTLVVPPLQNTLLGDVCPTTRSFGIVDNDPSDNVVTQYLLTSDGKIAQDTPANRQALNVTRVIGNGSDNRLLANFIDIAVGCAIYSAPDLINGTIPRLSNALNEIQANLNSPVDPATALVPSNDEMVLNNGVQCLQKLNLYRQGVNQPVVDILSDQLNINFCNGMKDFGVPFLILHQTEFQNFNSPDATGNNLLNFLCNRFFNSWNNLKCQALVNITSPITVTVDPNTGGAISNNLNTLVTVTTPVCCGTTVPTTINLCGTAYNNVNCTESCPNGVNTECITPGFTCFVVSSVNIPAYCNYKNVCGSNCTDKCPMFLDSECVTPGHTCVKDLNNSCKFDPNANRTLNTSPHNLPLVGSLASSVRVSSFVLMSILLILVMSLQ